MSSEDPSTISAVGDIHVVTFDLAKSVDTFISVGALISSNDDTSKSVDTYISVGSLIPSSSESVSCIYTWCQEGISMCIYWAEPTGWDVSRGPIPGATHTTFDEPCSVTDPPAVTSSSADQDIFEEITTLSHHRSGQGTLRTLGPETTSTQHEEDGTRDVESLETQGSVSIPTDFPCYHLYCEAGTLYCHYQAIMTGHDWAYNPFAGMTSTSVGLCPTAAAGGRARGERLTAIKE